MIRINLLDYRKTLKEIRVKKDILYAVILLAFVAGGLFYLDILKKDEISRLNVTFKKKGEELEALKKKVEKVAEFEKKEARLNDILKIIKVLKGKQLGTAKILDDINTRLPNEVWLQSIIEKDKRVSVMGYSFSNTGIASFMKNLEGGIYFKNIELVSSEQSEISGVKVKIFTLKLDFNIPERI